jgi:uncharacterized membrane protein
MTENKAPVPVSGASRGFKILLALSLAVNLAVLGVVAGTALKMRYDGERPTATRDIAFGPFTEALSRDQRRALFKGMAERGGNLRQAREQFRSDVAAIAESLRRSPFDAEEFRSLIAQQGARLEVRADEGRQALAALVTSMPEAERLEFADRLEQALQRRRRPRD